MLKTYQQLQIALEQVDAQLRIAGTKELVNQQQEKQVNSDCHPLEITYGYSREHRPDLKQYLMNIMSSSDGGVPLFFQVGNGNEAEKSRFPLLIQEFKKQWTCDEIEVFVADSALYSADNINTLGGLPWISRVPLSIKQAKHLVETLSSDKFSQSQLQAHDHKSGRPSKDKSPSRLRYHLQANLAVNTQALTVSQNKAGRFILATNLVDTTQWTHSNVLQEYKKQSVSERGFKFLKEPVFFADSVFVKSTKRVAALAMIMALCLLVYTIGQRQLRDNLIAANATLPNQLSKPTPSPTLRWIFQCFQSVHIVLVSGIQFVSNLTDERKHILQFLGSACQKYYLLC